MKGKLEGGKSSKEFSLFAGSGELNSGQVEAGYPNPLRRPDFQLQVGLYSTRLAKQSNNGLSVHQTKDLAKFYFLLLSILYRNFDEN